VLWPKKWDLVSRYVLHIILNWQSVGSFPNFPNDNLYTQGVPMFGFLCIVQFCCERQNTKISHFAPAEFRNVHNIQFRRWAHNAHHGGEKSDFYGSTFPAEILLRLTCPVWPAKSIQLKTHLPGTLKITVNKNGGNLAKVRDEKQSFFPFIPSPRSVVPPRR